MKKVELPNPFTPLLFIISGTSGAGKDSVIKQLVQRDWPFHFVVTTTSRAPREGEVEGLDYYFLSEDAFRNGIDEGQFIEHAIVYDQYKGVAKKQIQQALDSGKDVIMRLNVEGAATIKEKYEDAVLLFVTTDSQEELMERLAARKTDTEEQLEKRMRVAKEELELMDTFDYKVINRNNQLQETVDEVMEIVLQEHKMGKRKRITL